MTSQHGSEQRPETIAITAGRPAVTPDSALNPPISLNSTFTSGGPIGYGRYGNETWTALEAAIGALEAGRHFLIHQEWQQLAPFFQRCQLAPKLWHLIKAIQG